MWDDTFNVVISGSREFTDFWKFVDSLDIVLQPRLTKSAIRLFEGGARGIDKLAYQYSLLRKVRHHQFKADWDKHGKRAGILRNIEMIDAADMVVAFWDGQSKGTKHAIDHAIKKRKRCVIVRLDKEMSIEEVCPIDHYENRRMSDVLKDVGWKRLRKTIVEEFPEAA